jgi:predicted MarR family transcription regulator
MDSRYYRNWHLAKDETELSITELEYGVIRFHEAFTRWITTIGELTGMGGLKYTEHVIIHVIRMQDRPKTTATIARLINRDDMPNIQYSLRKLESAGLIRKRKEKGAKNYAYEMTARGLAVTDEYAKIRTELLVNNLQALTGIDRRAADTAQMLSIMTGIYEESARNSASFNHDR